MRRQSLIYCLVGPAGSGKTSNLQKLLLDYGSNLKNSVSVTTRSPRQNEVSGETREFVSEQEFRRLIQEDLLFEYEQIHGHFYGTRRATIERCFAESYDLVFDIDIQGALNLKKHFPLNTVIVFMVAPSHQVLVDRISNRGSIAEAELERRLLTASKEYQIFFDHLSKIDYFVVNHEVATTYQTLSAILHAERAKLSRVEINDLSQYVKKI